TGARPEHPMRPIPLHKHPHLAHWAALLVDGRASSTAIAMPWKSEACSAMDNPATLSAKVL
ncbi:hypothetical protein, partial [Lactobacillus delbrueckii]|uniref:hypothetical protein n=1 Tax=Lactobacillus delbrueckii TaxID=1584 RepID=UPI0025AFC352